MNTLRFTLLLAFGTFLGLPPAVAEHPPVTLRDQQGKNVLESGQPISTMQSCGGCHDTQYIAAHSYHVTLGADERVALGRVPGGRPWDWSPGPLGRWNALVYRYVAAEDDPRPDLTLSQWVATFPRHVGGGPALVGHDGVEMNCFLCHTPRPDNTARLKELHAGRFAWANTATLAQSGLVRAAGTKWEYDRAAFWADGRLEAAKLGLREPTVQNCGLCHGVAARGEQPLALDLAARPWSTATKGQVFSPQRICDSAVNQRDKEHLTRAWDVHAERLLECAHCHFSINNPAYYEATPRSRPAHLKFEPRRLTPRQYIEQPSHQFAKGHTSQGMLARHLDGTMRRCADCHDVAHGHDWLPYQQVHFARLSCEACHVPQVFAPAVRQVDWTLLTPAGEPLVEWRGIEGDPQNPVAEVTGFRPVLLPRTGLDGQQRLVPHNLVSAWYWVAGGAAPRPVRLDDLQKAVLQNGQYHPDIAAALAEGRPRLDTPAKVEAVRRRLIAVGVADPRIVAEVEPYGLHHGVGPAQTATRTCETCHTSNSRLAEPFELASYVPGGVRPTLASDGGTQSAGRLVTVGPTSLVYQPDTRQAALYVLGHDRWTAVNALGGFALLAVVVGVAAHAGLRIRGPRKSAAAPPSSHDDPNLVVPKRRKGPQ